MVSLYGVEFAPLNVPFERRMQTFAALHYVAVFILLPILSIFLPIYLLFTSYWWTVLLYAAWYCYDFKTPTLGSRRQEWFRRWALWNYFRDYFPISLIKTADFDPKKNYILGIHPHGIVSIGAFVNFGTEATGFSNLFPGITPSLCTLVGQFWFPFRREYVMLSGAIAVSRDSIEYQLNREGKGQAVVIVIGGASEALDAHPGNHTLVLSKRKGFIKLAIQNGANLVPVYSFGENDLFMQVSSGPDSLLRRLQIKWKKLLGYSPTLFHGRGIFNYTIGFLPFRKPINTVVGKPLDVKQCLQPTNEQIDQMHKKYVQAVIDLFEEHKLKYGLNEDDHLVIA